MLLNVTPVYLQAASWLRQKPLTAREFRDVAEEEGRLPPNKERDKEDKLLERAFWSRCAESSAQATHMRDA